RRSSMGGQDGGHGLQEFGDGAGAQWGQMGPLPLLPAERSGHGVAVVPTMQGRFYSHSMVPGGLLVISKQTRLTPLTSLIIRLESFSKSSYGSFTQSAVIPSCDSTARIAIVYS